MSAAVDLNILDARIQRELLASYRDMIHKAVDDFVDALAEDLLSDRKMTLMEITQAILKAKPEFLTAAMEEFIRSKHGDILSQEQAQCPCCNRKVQRSVQAPRTIETLLGTSTVTRPYFYCAPCGSITYFLKNSLRSLSGLVTLFSVRRQDHGYGSHYTWQTHQAGGAWSN